MPRDAAAIPSRFGPIPSKTSHFLEGRDEEHPDARPMSSARCLRLDATCTETHQQLDLPPNLHPFGHG
jgi:hypothetical protein